MRAYCALCLAADDHDVTAWRSWLGFDDHLLNSAVWARFCVWSNAQGLEPLVALQRLAESNDGEPFLQWERLAQAYRTGQALISTLQAQDGFALIKTLEALFNGLPDDLRLLIDPIEGTETVGDLAARASRQLFDPYFRGGGIRVGSLESAYAVNAKLVVLPGLIEGYLPTLEAIDPTADPNATSRLLDQQSHLLHGALMRTSNELLLSYFQKEDMNQAETLKLNVSRIRVDHGVRMALVAPSRFLDTMGSALPGAVSFL